MTRFKPPLLPVNLVPPFVTGTKTLASGAGTVTDSRIKSTSLIFLSNGGLSGTVGTLSYSISAGTSFTITSANVLDTSTISYLIIY